MLCPDLHRQRVSIEFLTNKNLYDTELTEALLVDFLYDLTATLDMTMLIEPIVRTVPDGTSAYVMYQESGCHIHSWYDQKFVSIDVYSCKPFLVSDVLNIIDFWFEPTIVEIL